MYMNEYIIDAKATVLETMTYMDKSGKKTLFIVENERVKAAVTDGDVRRWILSKGELEVLVFELQTKCPRALRGKYC